MAPAAGANMKTSEVILMLFQVLGGLSLFIYGMNGMTGNLRAAAGNSLRDILAKATRSPVHGVVFGVVVGFLAHSGAAISMLAGFINAGVMSLIQSLAPIYGANIGTSLSSQVISFNITQYCWVAIGIGFLARSFIRSERWSKLGDAGIGFGLLFLGMATISHAIAPHKELLAPYLSGIRGDVWTWRLAGVGISTVLTALLTSSGAMIGLTFALATAGVFTEFHQVAVIILGAMVGTCIVPVMASLPMRIAAKRAALAHVLFNVVNVGLALAAWPWLMRFCEWSAPGNLVRQGANLHVLLMTAGTLVMLPLSRAFMRFILWITPSKEPEPDPSFLEEKLLVKPEAALEAVIKELRRMAKICVDSMMVNGHLILEPSQPLYRKLMANEEVINEIRHSMEAYLGRLTRRYLSRRQTLFVQHLHSCMKDIERIGDHLAHIGDTSVERMRIKGALVPEDLFKTWFMLFCSAKRVIAMMADSFGQTDEPFQKTALKILRARDAYMIQSMDAKADFVGASREKRISPVAGYYLNRYVEDLDRLVRRAKSVAFSERQPDFWVKQTKLEKSVGDPGEYEPAKPVDPSAYLKMLRQATPFDDSDLPEEITSHIPARAPHSAPDGEWTATEDDDAPDTDEDPDAAHGIRPPPSVPHPSDAAKPREDSP